MTDFESRLRESLVERAEDAPGPAGLTAGARARLRHRRTTRAKVAAAATSLTVATLAVAFVEVPSFERSPEQVAPDAPFVVPDLSVDLVPEIQSSRATLQEVTWLGIRFVAPSDWRSGATTAWCARRTDPAGEAPRIDLPDGPRPKIECTPTRGYGVTVSSAVGFDPAYESRYVWKYDAEVDAPGTYPDDAWLSSWYDDDWVVTIATPDPGLTSRIVRSVRGEEVDANGCVVTFDEEATRTTQGPRGVGAALCRYSPEGELEDSQRLTYVEVDAALAAISAASELPESQGCVQQEGWLVTLTPAGESAYLARYGTQDLGSCQDGVESTAPQQLVSRGQLEITSEVRTAFGLDDVPAD